MKGLLILLSLCLMNGHAVSAEEESGFFSNMINKVSAMVTSFYKTYETPSYSVTQNFGEFEERNYPGGTKWVCTKSTSPRDTEGSVVTMFWKLFRYINGNNQEGVKMDMTVPVSTKHPGPPDGDASDSTSRADQVERTMCFFLPAAHQQSPPEPSDEKVFLQTWPELNVYTRRRGGYMTETSWNTEANNLIGLVEDEGLEVEKDYYYTNGYDSPMKFLNRRNEVWLLKK